MIFLQKKNNPYIKIFYDVYDHQLYPIAWLREHGGKQSEDWDEYFEGKHHVIIGWDNDVGTIGDLHITIYNPIVAFQFEMFKVGGAQYYK